MIKNIILSLLISTGLFAIELSNTVNTEGTDSNTSQRSSSVKVFGYNLFNGSFSKNNQHRYNPHYRINIGDTINVKIWGAFELEAPLVVDSQGNIFLPKVGTLRVMGTRNDELSKKLKRALKREFRSNVYIYADLAAYQAVSVFVTGAVNKPGLYEGLSSDSILQFLDKAKGITAETGSYRHIKVLRDNKKLNELDLYDFLINGNLKIFQFQMGDVIVVDSVKDYLEITGDVKRPYRYELKKPFTTLAIVKKVVLANPTATNILVKHWTQDNKQSTKIYKISDNLDLKIYAGESIEFIPDHQAQSIAINIKGEHNDIHKLVVPKGTNLEEVYSKIKLSVLSDAGAFQLYRKSVALQQKELILASLDDLEAKTLTSGSSSNEEAALRQQESALVLSFIDRARKAEPRGQVIINIDTNLSEVILEDEDSIFIPKKSHMVIIQGEVKLPGAQTYVQSLSYEDYINSCGGYGFRADTENILIIHKNGSVESFDADAWFSSDAKINPGDSILVLSKVETKYLQAIKDITQIIYQIAIGAAVVIRY